jgi:hypothetical protein
LTLFFLIEKNLKNKYFNREIEIKQNKKGNNDFYNLNVSIELLKEKSYFSHLILFFISIYKKERHRQPPLAQ